MFTHLTCLCNILYCSACVFVCVCVTLSHSVSRPSHARGVCVIVCKCECLFVLSLIFGSALACHFISKQRFSFTFFSVCVHPICTHVHVCLFIQFQLCVLPCLFVSLMSANVLVCLCVFESLHARRLSFLFGLCRQMSVPGNRGEQWSPRAKGQSPGEGQHQSVA